MKYLLFLFLSFNLFAQGIIFKAPRINIPDVNLGVSDTSSTLDTNTVSATVNTRRCVVDSIISSDTTMLKVQTIVSGLVEYGTTSNFTILTDISTEGNYNKSLYVYHTARQRIDTVSVTWSVQIGEGVISAPTSLAIRDSSDGLLLKWDANTESISGYKIYRSTDNTNYSLLTTVAGMSQPQYDDTDIIEALRYYYYVTAYKSTESSSSDTVNSKSLVTLDDYDAVIYIDSSTAVADTLQLGTYTAPYNSLSDVIWNSLDVDYAGTNIKVFIKGGYQYIGNIIMLDVDATSSDPIIIDVYGSTERYVLRNTDLTNIQWVVQLCQNSTSSDVGSSYITLKNAEIIGCRWLDLWNSENITIDNCYMHHYSNTDATYADVGGVAPIRAYGNNSAYFTFKNSIFEGTHYTTNNYDMLQLRGSDYVLIENNIFKNAPHTLIGLGSSSVFETDNIIIRNNILYNKYHSTINVQVQASNYLIENNYFIKAGIGGRDAGISDPDFNITDARGAIYLNGDNLIFRNNLVSQHGSPYRVVGYPTTVSILGAIEMATADYGSYENDANNNRFYNNTIYNNYAFGLLMGMAGSATTGQTFTDNYVFNNAFVLNGDNTWTSGIGGSNNADSASIMLYDGNSTLDPSSNYVTYNYFSSVDTSVVFRDGGTTKYFYDANTYPTTSKFSLTSNIDGGISVFDAPVDSIALTYWDANGSMISFLDSLQVYFNPSAELQNTGRHLATVTSNTSSSAILPVSDGKAFFGGFSWLDGDSIQIANGSTISYNRITSISGNNLTLATEGTYTSGSYVDVVNSQLGSYSGSGVDIGMFEYQTTDTLVPSNLDEFVVYASSDSANFGLNFKTNYATTSLVFQLATASEDVPSAPETVPIPSPVLGTSGTSTINHGSGGLSLGQVYYYRWVLTNSKGTTTGSVQSYTHLPPTAVTGETNSAVAQTYDDLGYYATGTSSTNYVGDVGGTDVNTALRFPSITVAQSSTVDSAFIILTANGNYSGTNCNIRVYGELRESPDSVTIFTASGTIMNTRDDSVTTAYVDTTMGAWTQDVEYRFNVTSIVQELVNTHNYSSQPISFFIKDNASTTGANRRFYRYEDGSKYARINIYYTE